MKFISIFAAVALADDENPHDPEAMAFCRGKPEGFYQNVNDCETFFFCWGGGKWGDKMYCPPGTTYNERLMVCNWPYCLPANNQCYQPCGWSCNGMTQEEIWDAYCDTSE